MAERELPAELRELIKWKLESIDHMEMLVLLHRSAPRAWSIEELARELHLPVRTTAGCMGSLVRGDLSAIAQDPADPASAARYRYAPASPALARSVDLLAREYDERPVALVTAVRNRPSVVLQSFAEAFRMRKRP